MSKHTPGPWYQLHRQPLCIESPTGNVALCNLARASDADAKLIAAAPDLLALVRQYASECASCEGLGRVVQFNADGYPAGEVPCPDCDEIRAVITKATGNS